MEAILPMDGKCFFSEVTFFSLGNLSSQTLMVSVRFHTYSSHFFFINPLENDTWACVDMEFLFECSTSWLTSETSSWARLWYPKGILHNCFCCWINIVGLYWQEKLAFINEWKKGTTICGKKIRKVLWSCLFSSVLSQEKCYCQTVGFFISILVFFSFSNILNVTACL